MPRRTASDGCRTSHGLALDEHRAGVARIGADDRAGELRAARPEQAREADHLAAVDLQAHVVQHAPAPDAFDAQQFLAAGRAALREVLRELPVRHQPDEMGERARRPRGASRRGGRPASR